MDQLTPVSSTLGGLLIGFAGIVLLAMNGRIAGISGITGGLLGTRAGDRGWRLTFTLGLLVGGGVMLALRPEAFGALDLPIWQIVVAGLLVGFGTRLGSGCTSGHGVCGMSRLSKRSFAATLTFMAFGMATVALMRIGGLG